MSSTRHLIRPTWRVLWGCADDDPYSAWFNAEQRCGEALQAWRDAQGASARNAAYLAYCFAIDVEERAAKELARVAAPRIAA
jgi:hypothetical protein